MTLKDRKDMREIISSFIKVARHARNFPHPEIPIERLRSEAVEAEVLAERILGKKEWNICNEKAFKQ